MIEKDGVETTVPIAQVKKGDVFVVRPGENIPVDGIVLEGNSAVNESALTGESIPVDKAAGDLVSAANLKPVRIYPLRGVQSRRGHDAPQIIKMVSDAAATKLRSRRSQIKVSGVFVPAVITIAVITTIGWLLAGETMAFALARGISVLVISCPCVRPCDSGLPSWSATEWERRTEFSLRQRFPLEETGKVEIVALDKTGTITKVANPA